MKVVQTALPGVMSIIPVRHGDSRGYFAETFKDAWFRANVADVTFVQDNESLSATAGTVRGLHFQAPPFAQGKLVRCLRGAVLDVAVDIRKGSPSFGRWIGEVLSADNGAQLWIPAGFAHGFETLEDGTQLAYKVTASYDAASDRGIRWDDPAIAVGWRGTTGTATLSAKDRVQPLLAEIDSPFHIES